MQEEETNLTTVRSDGAVSDTTDKEEEGATDKEEEGRTSGGDGDEFPPSTCNGQIPNLDTVTGDNPCLVQIPHDLIENVK